MTLCEFNTARAASRVERATRRRQRRSTWKRKMERARIALSTLRSDAMQCIRQKSSSLLTAVRVRRAASAATSVNDDDDCSRNGAEGVSSVHSASSESPSPHNEGANTSPIAWKSALLTATERGSIAELSSKALLSSRSPRLKKGNTTENFALFNQLINFSGLSSTASRLLALDCRPVPTLELRVSMVRLRVNSRTTSAAHPHSSCLPSHVTPHSSPSPPTTAIAAGDVGGPLRERQLSPRHARHGDLNASVCGRRVALLHVWSALHRSNLQHIMCSGVALRSRNRPCAQQGRVTTVTLAMAPQR